MSNSKRIALAIIVLGILVESRPSVGAPHSVPYVGLLSFDGGAPYNGNLNLTAAIYGVSNPDPVADTPIWGPHDYGEIVVSQGLLAFVLGGDGSPALTPALLDSSPGGIWVLVHINGSPMSPAQRVHAVPYALKAASAERVGNISASEVATHADLAELGSGSFAIANCREEVGYVNLQHGAPGCDKGNYGTCVRQFSCAPGEFIFRYNLEPYSRHWWGGYVDSYQGTKINATTLSVYVSSNSFWSGQAGSCAYAPMDCGNVRAVLTCCPNG